jgi:hypothetical protein
VRGLRLFDPVGPHCLSCRLLPVCGSELNDYACAPKLDFSAMSQFQLHPLRPDFDKQIDAVGGVLFDDISGHLLAPVSLPAYLPQGRWRPAESVGSISSTEFPLIGIRLHDVFRNGEIRTTHEVREKLGLGDDTCIVLLLHGHDELLERFGSGAHATEIAAAGYALVTSPSYSLWEPQRRPDNLVSLRRSLQSYAELASAGANVCLRVGWVEPIDVERLAAWVNEWDIELVSLDLMTYSDVSFARAMGGLVYFDALTDGNVHYLVDGVSAWNRIAHVYLATGVDRVTVSNATLAPPASKLGGAQSFRRRTAFFNQRCTEAAAAVQRASSSTVEEFIERTLEEWSVERRAA